MWNRISKSFGRASWPLIALLGLAVIGFSGTKPPKKKLDQVFRVGFYNLENLFDWEDDPQIDDQEFLPDAKLAWTKERFYKKIENLGKVIKDLSPDVMGVCEVENRKVLDYLITKTSLKKENYSLVHYDSPDKRGIDVGLIYKKGRFNVIKTASYAVIFPGDMEKPSRDILYVKGRTATGEELHFVVNHWPSRSGGKEKTEGKRILAAKTARRLCDSIFFSDNSAHIVLMGDFNDYPNDRSVSETLGAQVDSTFSGNTFYNLMGWRQQIGQGSYNYKGSWGFLDQIIVSSSLIQGSGGLQVYFKQADIAKYKFLIAGKKTGIAGIPLPTYKEDQYMGGYSDHFPVYADFNLKPKK